MKCLVNASPWHIHFCYCPYIFAVLLLLQPLTSALISADSKTMEMSKKTSVASNVSSKADEVVEGSGGFYPVKNKKNEPQIRPDTEFNSSGASPDDEDGDVNEGSGDVEGSGSEPPLSTSSKSPFLVSTSHTPAVAITTAKPRHQFNEERIVHGENELSRTQEPSSTRPLILVQSTTTSSSTPTTRPTLLTMETRPPTPIYGSESGEFEMLKPGILAAVSGGAVVGILMTILLVMFIIYRMRKKDEGSYCLDEPHAPPNYSYAYQKASTKEFYA